MSSPIFKISDVDGVPTEGSIDVLGVEVTGIPYVSTHVIKIKPGWNIISTYINMDTKTANSSGGTSKNIEDIFSSISGADDVVIVKDYDGNAYLPVWNFNGIGDWDNDPTLGQNVGFQVKNNSNQIHTIVIEGEILYSDNTYTIPGTTINFPQGWSNIAWPFVLSGEVINVLGEYSDKILILKDNNGVAWLPQWDFNGIGNLRAGQGYQVKTTEAFSVTIDGSDFVPGGFGDVSGFIGDEDTEEDNVDDEVTEGSTDTDLGFNILTEHGVVKEFINTIDLHEDVVNPHISVLEEFGISKEPSIDELIVRDGYRHTFEAINSDNKIILDALMSKQLKEEKILDAPSLESKVEENLDLFFRKWNLLSNLVSEYDEYNIQIETASGVSWSSSRRWSQKNAPGGAVQFVCPMDSDPTDQEIDGFLSLEEYFVYLIGKDKNIKNLLIVDYDSSNSTPTTDLNLAHDRGVKVVKKLSFKNKTGYTIMPSK